MSDGVIIFYYSIVSAALMMSLMGLWFAAVLPGMDRWNKRFFLGYFIVFALCCVTGLIEFTLECNPVSFAALFWALVADCVFLSAPLPMITVYLLHCCGENPRRSRLMYAVLYFWGAYLLLLAVSPFIGVFAYTLPKKEIVRGPSYPIVLLPMVAILLLNFVGLIRRRAKLSRKVFIGFLAAIVPILVTLIVQVFIDVLPLVDISIVISALSTYGFVMSDQIERDLRQQREIAHERASVMVLQMRPHFIYNTLMSIYSLCNIDPQKARQVTADFTDYLRKNFNAVASDSPILFSAELEHTRAYLAVEQAQHEDMLAVEYDTPFTHFRLPPLTLQPLVENAVKHGMNPYSGPLHVSLRTRYTDSAVEITVEDDGPGFDPKDESRPHTTLNNIRQRLEMMCGGSMTIKPREGGGAAVTIKLPPPPREQADQAV